ncbi:MAG: hypothetical protein LBO66_08440 [Deltaproteobacteria bacterium]|jgi:Fe-S cluster assembly iron-binding protein IscA|nr:hypothetical protein [Deltaproteobacteria bacterium]
MIDITPVALDELTAFFRGRQVTSAVRVILPPASCGGGGQLSLTVDSPDEDDFFARAGDLTLVIRRTLLERVGKVTIDYQSQGRETGFVVIPEKILPPAPKDCARCLGCDA